MKIIRIISMVAFVVALPASASALGYSVAQRYSWPGATNIAVAKNGRGLGATQASSGGRQIMDLHYTPREDRSAVSQSH